MGTDLRAGLRLRLRRALQRTEGQHRQLRALLRAAEQAAKAGAELAEPLRLLRDNLRAHFELEEGVSFPALHGLSPGAQPSLEQLAREHHSFLGDLSSLLAGPPAAGDGVLRLGAALREHERREEQLLESIVGRGPRGA